MTTGEGPNRSDESYGDVAAAMELVVALGAAETPAPQVVRDMLRRVDPGELLQGLNTLILTLMRVFDHPTNVVMPLVRRLRDRELVSADFLPTATALLTAAALDQSPLRWRSRFGRVDAAETANWAHTAAQLADLVDYTAGEGTAAQVTNRAFGGLAERQPRN